jgi:hypothetical protein
MSSALADRDEVPAIDSPLDVLDVGLTGGGALGLATYVVGLLLGNLEAATLGVGLGVVCVLATLGVRSLRAVG